MAYSNLSQLGMLGANTDEAVAWGGRAIELAESLCQTETLVHALNNVGTAEMQAGRPGGQATLERSLALALAHGLEEHVARAYTNLAWEALYLRDYPLASRYLDEGIRYCTERDLDTLRLYMLASQARADFEQGRWPAATRTVEVVLRDPRTAPVSRIDALAVLGRVRARRGDRGAWPPLDEALALATATGELQRLGPVAVARAEAAWLEGDPGAARAGVEDALGLAQRTKSYAWPTGELAFWLWRLGGPDRLPTGGLPAGAAEPFALQMAGAWDAAAARWRAIGCLYEAAAALADSDQEPQLRLALAELERLGARPLTAAVARKLRELGVRGLPRGPRRATRANPANLTARELEVLRLLVEGRSNRQIAEQLFISGKTASVHVTNLMTKLGAHSRLEAAAMARRLGLEQPAERES
jgi:DNA-binding CsgD family transcriptional regulator